MSGKIRVGIWGLGRAGWCMHRPELERFADKFEIVAGCDMDPARAEMLTKQYPAAKGYTDGDAFLADPAIELVSVAVFSPQHVSYVIRALEAGKYVFAEKPVALTVEGAQQLKAAAAKHPGKLFCRHNRRFESAFNHVREIIDSGILGDVYEIKLCRHNYQFRDDWQTLIDRGGGQLNNWGPHLIDHGLRLLDSPVESVWSDLKCVAARGDAEDHVKVILRGTNGRVIDIEISGGVTIPSPVYAVYGRRGTLICEDEQDIRLKYLAPDFAWPDNPPRTASPSLENGFGWAAKPRWIRKTIMVEPSNHADVGDIYGRLYAAIREGVPFPIKLDQALEVVRVTELVKRQNPAFTIHPDDPVQK